MSQYWCLGRLFTNRLKTAGLALVLCGGAAHASDDDGRYSTHNAFGCPKVIQAIGDESAARAKQQSPDPDTSYNVNYQRVTNWVSGWLTAYNALTPDTYRLADMPTFMVWVEDFCRQNPSANLAGAIDSYAVANHPRRQRKGPAR